VAKFFVPYYKNNYSIADLIKRAWWLLRFCALMQYLQAGLPKNVRKLEQIEYGTADFDRWFNVANNYQLVPHDKNKFEEFYNSTDA
jgi:molybdopterin converting factor small subunit